MMEKYEEEVAQRKIERERQKLIEQKAIQDPPQESPPDKNNKPKQGESEQTEKHVRRESYDVNDEQTQTAQQQKEPEKPSSR